MVGEDYRSYAFKHVDVIGELKGKLEEKKIELEQKNKTIIELYA
jgi:hypothetical protein